MTTGNIVLFLVITVILIWFSWYISIKEKRYHGLYRFFSFECIILLIILNYREWFVLPFSLFQIFSWLFLLGSAIFAILGFQILSLRGKAKGKFENTTELITSGLYKYIRHPLYLSLMLLGTGVMLKNPDTIQMITAILNLISLCLTARVEEKEMLARFGEEYQKYMKRSKMFIPFIF